MTAQKFTVIGAGNGGKAMAAHLALMDQDVTLFNRTFGHIEVIAKRAGSTWKVRPTGRVGLARSSW